MSGMRHEGTRVQPRPSARHLAIALLATLAAVRPAGAQDSSGVAPPAIPITSLPDVTVTAPEPRYVAPTTRDRIGRIWAPVLINGQGPFRLVLDTGASHSAITRRVAESLGVPIKEDSVRLRGVTGSAVAASIQADTIEVGDLLVQDARMPIVADAFGGADGVLGAEGLADKRIVIEFTRDQIRIARSHRERAQDGYSRVPFRFSDHRGMRVDVLVGTVRATAVIDTGAQVTVGNLALREALYRRRGKPEELDDTIIGVTEDIQQAARVRVPTIVAGSLLVRDASIMFTDLVIFDHWKLNSQPAILIGMDVLGVVDTLIVDYRLGELQIRTRP
jgi:predicted aspartyl protease